MAAFLHGGYVVGAAAPHLKGLTLPALARLTSEHPGLFSTYRTARQGIHLARAISGRDNRSLDQKWNLQKDEKSLSLFSNDLTKVPEFNEVDEFFAGPGDGLSLQLGVLDSDRGG